MIDRRCHRPWLFAAGALLALAASATAAAAQTTVLEAVRAALRPEAVVSWQRVEGDDADLQLSGVTLRPHGADDRSSWLTIDRVRLLPNADAADRPGFLPRFARVELEGLRLQAPNQRGYALIDLLVLEDVHVPGRFVAAIVTTAETDEEEADETDDEAAAEDAAGDDDPIEDALAGMVVGEALARGIRQIEPVAGEAVETLRLAELSLAGIAEGRIGRLIAADLAIDTVQGSLTLDRFVLAGLDMVVTAAIAAAAEALEVPEDEAFSFDPGLERLEVAGLTLTDPAAATLLTLERLAVEDIRRLDREIVEGRFVLADLALPVGSLDEQALEAALTAMGYGDLTLSMEFAAAIDPAAETLTVSPVQIDLDEMAELNLSLSMGRFDLDEMIDQLRQLGGGGLPTLPRATFNGLEIDLSDDGLTDRLLAYAAEETDGGRQAVIDGVVAAVAGQLEARRITGPLGEQAVGAVTAFLEEPSRLVVRAVPASPVSLLELGIGFVAAPETTMTRLGAEILHEDRP